MCELVIVRDFIYWFKRVFIMYYEKLIFKCFGYIGKWFFFKIKFSGLIFKIFSGLFYYISDLIMIGFGFLF